MDNRIFNVNGRGLDMLRKALTLAFAQEGERCRAAAWKFDPEKGLILYWHADEKYDKVHKFPVPMDAEGCAVVADQWLNTDEAKNMKCDGWDADADHDGSNSRGWRVYCEDWGHVAESHYAIVAVRPAYMWHGK